MRRSPRRRRRSSRVGKTSGSAADLEAMFEDPLEKSSEIWRKVVDRERKTKRDCRSRTPHPTSQSLSRHRSLAACASIARRASRFRATSPASPRPASSAARRSAGRAPTKPPLARTPSPTPRSARRPSRPRNRSARGARRARRRASRVRFAFGRRGDRVRVSRSRVARFRTNKDGVRTSGSSDRSRRRGRRVEAKRAPGPASARSARRGPRLCPRHRGACVAAPTRTAWSRATRAEAASETAATSNALFRTPCFSGASFSSRRLRFALSPRRGRRRRRRRGDSRHFLTREA